MKTKANLRAHTKMKNRMNTESIKNDIRIIFVEIR